MQRKKRTGETLKKISCEVCSYNNPAALHIHHIIPLRVDPSLSLDIENGITLCRECHTKTFRKELDFAEKYRKIVENKCEK